MNKKPTKVAPKPVRASAPATRPVSAIIRPSVVEVLEVALQKTTESSTLFADRLVAMEHAKAIEQPDLHAVQLFGRVSKVADDSEKAFKLFARSLRLEAEAKLPPGSTEVPRLNVVPGPRVLAWQDNRKITLQWKDETMKLARVLHAVADAYAKGDTASLGTLLAPFRGVFDEANFEAVLKKGKEKKGELTPQIVEGS